MTGQLVCKCDYLEFTTPAEYLGDVLAMFPTFERAAHGWRGYTRSALVAFGKGRVGWHPDRPEMGVHVSLGSQALDILAGQDDQWLDRPSVVEFIQDELGGRVTRFDAAFDDFDGLLDLAVIGQAVAGKDYVSRWRRKPRHMTDYETGGQTWYFGSAASDAFCLIYDKRAEREHMANRGKCEPFDGDHWVRVELRLRRERANAAASMFKRAKADASSVMRDLAGVLRHYLEFKAPGKDSNLRRRPVAAWWLEFIGFVERAKLELPTPEVKTVDDSVSYVVRQVAPTLAVIREYMGPEVYRKWVKQETDEGKHRWKAHHKARLVASGVAA